MKSEMSLSSVDEVEIISIVDNSIDVFLKDTKIVHRFDVSNIKFNSTSNPYLLAEHGLAIIIKFNYEGKSTMILLDTGSSTDTIIHNCNILNLNLRDLQAIVLSHGHIDHTAGLASILEKKIVDPIPLVVHPNAFLEKSIIMPSCKPMDVSMPSLTRKQKDKIFPIIKKEPTFLFNNHLLVSGEISRVTSFEKGFPFHYAKKNNLWENDPMVLEDQCIILKLGKKG